MGRRWGGAGVGSAQHAVSVCDYEQGLVLSSLSFDHPVSLARGVSFVLCGLLKNASCYGVWLVVVEADTKWLCHANLRTTTQ